MLLIKNKKRFKNENNKIKIDKKGSKRIVNCILGNLKFRILKLESNTKDLNLNYKNNIAKINLKDGMYKVKDSQINNYLLSKNLKKNRQVSINTKTIKNIDNYIWWLTQKVNYIISLEITK